MFIHEREPAGPRYIPGQCSHVAGMDGTKDIPVMILTDGWDGASEIAVQFLARDRVRVIQRGEVRLISAFHLTEG